MEFQIWLAYISSVLILMITPGPSQLLMLSNSLGNGFKRSIATVAGDLTANSFQMVVASFGLASILYASQYFFYDNQMAGCCLSDLYGYQIDHTQTSVKPN